MMWNCWQTKLCNNVYRRQNVNWWNGSVHSMLCHIMCCTGIWLCYCRSFGITMLSTGLWLILWYRSRRQRFPCQVMILLKHQQLTYQRNLKLIQKRSKLLLPLKHQERRRQSHCLGNWLHRGLGILYCETNCRQMKQLLWPVMDHLPLTLDWQQTPKVSCNIN